LTYSQHNVASAYNQRYRGAAAVRRIMVQELERQSSRKPTNVNSLLILLSFLLFIPIELSFYLSGFRFTSARLILLIGVPVAAIAGLKKMVGGRYRFVIPDLFVALTAFWMILAPANVEGLEAALTHAGPDVLELCGAYLLTRFLFNDPGEVVEFSILLSRVIACVAIIGMLEELPGYYVIHTVARQLTGFGGADLNEWPARYRLGLLRATGTIEHPILYGYICLIGLILAISSSAKFRKLTSICCGLGLVLSFSSGPLQAAVLALGLIIYDRTTVSVPFRWAALSVVGVAIAAAVFLISESPVNYMIAHFTLDPGTGFYRIWLWDNVFAAVSHSPWFGLGYGRLSGVPAMVNNSIDSIWLVLSIHSGIPGAVFFFLLLLAAAVVPARDGPARLTREADRLASAISILIIATIYTGITVDFWGQPWILIGLLIGCRSYLCELGRSDLHSDDSVTQRELRRSRRPRLLMADREKCGFGESHLNLGTPAGRGEGGQPFGQSDV